GAVTCGASLDLNDDGFADILAQPVGQPGSVIAVFTDGAGGLLSTATISTGLEVESESIAARGDVIGSRLRVLAFLSTTGGTRLTVVFSDGAGGFTAPVELPVDASAQLRSLKLYDVNGDLMPDLIAIRQLPGGDARLIVFTRISETEFAPGIESAITVRDTSSSTTLMDYAVGDFDADLLNDVAVIGDDRVRIYKGDGTGAYTLLSDVPLPAGVTASAIATPYGGAVVVGENLIVVARDSAAPDRKMVLLYQNTGFPGNASFAQPARLNYTVPAGAAGDSRLLIGHFAGEAFIEEAIVVDGETVTAFVDVVR
ncbi:MAG TPA: hypothetical protein VLU47_05830, partial [Blastocatellia bacterium]|nr:hypothetical protein [Blastocatellia bacterium]